MSENIFATFDISGQGMSVQRMRLNAVARNIANANTTNGPDGQPYQREVVKVTSTGKRNFNSELKNSLNLNITDDNLTGSASIRPEAQDNTTLEAVTVKDGMPPRMVYDPHHPDANEDGYVMMPDINIVTEMVEMISAQRAFQANASVIDSAKNIARFSFEI
jgi:flagellar basal-body rod protein FlgC